MSQQALTLGVPYRVPALDYTAFNDSDTVHEGNCGSGPVDAEVTTDPNGSGCDVGWTHAGEWLEYSIQVASARKFNIVSRVSSALTGKTFRILVDGASIGGSQTVPSAGWQAFADRTLPDVSLAQGTHTLRVLFETGDTNLNYIDITPGTVNVAQRIQAEDYQRAFESTPASNTGNACDRADGVDKETTSDNAGGCDVGWTTAGEWLEYTIQIASAGKFDIVSRVASGTTGRTFQLSIDGTSIGGSQTVPSAGWQAFADRTVTNVSLAQGTHNLRVRFETGDTNLNYIDITPGTVTLPARIEAEDYQRALESTPTTNSGGACDRGDGVDKEITGDFTGVCDVGWTTAGEWLEYDVNAPLAGLFDLTARVGSGVTGRTIQINVDGASVGTLSAPSTGWSTFEDRKIESINLAAGPHIIRVLFVQGDTNLNYLDIGAHGTVVSNAVYSFGAAAGYNAFVFQDLLATPNIAGPVAAGRDISTQGFGYNTSAAGSIGVVVGRNFTGSSGSVHRDLVYGNTLSLNGVGVLQGTSHQGNPIDFTAEKTTLLSTTANLAKLTSNGTTTISQDGTTIDFNGADPTRNVFSLDGAALGATDALRFFVPSSSTVLVNVTGTAAVFETTGMQLGGLTPGHLVWNLPQASTVRLAQVGFEGTLLAVNAAVTQSSSTLDGVLIATSLTGGDNGLTWQPFNGTFPSGCSSGAEAASCSDGNACNGLETCTSNGTCAPGNPPVLDDGNPCTADTCDPVAGVKHTAVVDGTACSDGNACNGAELCAHGTCTPGAALAVDDGNPCTADSCDPQAGVRHTPVAAGTSCSDNNACNGTETCSATGICTAGASPVVDDGNPCTADACDPVHGVTHAALANGTSCADANVCNGSEKCQAGACVAGSAPVLDDGNPCTSDACDPVHGVTHVAVANGTSCADANVCNGSEVCTSGTCTAGTALAVDDGNPCTTDTCDATTGVHHAPVAAGSSCTDGNACNGSETCNANGACVASAAPVVDDGNPCTIDACNPSTGVSHVAVPSGTACSDGNACNGSETCNALAACRPGTAPVVDDSNPCTTDSCDPASGVHHVPVSVGTSCSDGNACNGQESCNASGACVAANAPVLDDGNPCTIDACDPNTGVSHTVAPAGTHCDNATLCDGREVCSATGACLPGTAPVIDDGNPCTTDSCDATAGVSHAPVAAGTSCDDSDVCNGREACNSIGMCAVGPALVVDDNNPCTIDSCEAKNGVRHDAQPAGTSCSDNNVCNGAELCDATAHCAAGTPLTVDDGNPCTTDSCDPATGPKHVAIAPGGSCDDADVCNGHETCSASGQCVSAAPPSVDDNNPCTVDACDPVHGVTHTPAISGTSCSDSNACNGSEVCDGAGHCPAATPPAVDDGNPCTADSCSPTDGVKHVPVASGTSCDDGNVCNGVSRCDASGACVAGTPLVVDDGNPCTIDSCSPASGVTHTVASAGTACDNATVCDGREKCDASGHCQAGTALAVDDGNSCTADTCDPTLGVQHSPTADGSSCSDGNACTQGDTCHAGTCTSGASVSCASADPCQGSACNPNTGACTQTPKPDGTACTPATACTTGATCHTGQCTGGTPVNVDDNNPCTTDSCDPITGAKHVPAPSGTLCGDNNACNGQETCSGSGACIPGVSPTLSDGNPCTLDTCDPVAGVQHQALSAGSACDDSTVCNGREVCNATGACVTAPGSDILDDGNPCTADHCDPIAGTSHLPTPLGSSCDDSTVCNGRETCDGNGSCNRHSDPPLQSDGNPCTFDTCDDVLGVQHAPVPAGSGCGDGNACNGNELCNATGQCLPGMPPQVDDGNPCTTDSCDPVLGQVRHDPLPGGSSCDNGNVCDGVSTCDGAGACRSGTPPVVDDGDPCTLDSCDPFAGVQHVHPTSGSCAGAGGWQTLLPSQPSPRDSSAASFTDTSELFVFGGENAGVSLADGWLWSPSHRAWRRAAAGPSARSGSAIGFDSQRGRVIVYGGVAGADANAQYLGDVWEYVVATDSWQARPAVGAAPANRALAAFAYDSVNQRGLLFGGVSPTHLADTWEWSASTGAWTQVGAQGPTARFGAAFAFDSVHKIYVLFGGSPQGVTGGALADTWTFDANTGVWSARTPPISPPARAGASMTYDASVSRLVMVGGTSVDSLNLADAWEFDATTGNWASLTASAPPALTGAVTGFDAVAGQVLVTGGLSYSDSGKFTADSSLVWSFARPTQQWALRTVTSAPAELAPGAVFDTNTNRIVARAAVDSFDTSTRPVTWNYDGASRVWQATDAAALSTDFGSGAFKGVGTLLYDAARKLTLRVFGFGFGGIGFPYLQLAEWNGAQWTNGCYFPGSDSSNFGVTDATYVFDPPRERVLAFGDGRVIAVDPAHCTAADIPQTVPAPSRRLLASVAWDSNRDVFVLFGGSVEPHLNNGLETADTWEFNPHTSKWSLIATANAPSARYGATMVYDSKRKKMVLYGGGFGARNILRDTWEYGPQGWFEVSASGGPASGAATILFDPVRNGVTLVSTDGNVSTWNGFSWVQDANTASPSARSGMSGGWVSSQGAAFLFGGVSGDGRRTFLNDLWMWNGGWRLMSFPGPDPSPLLWGTWENSTSQLSTAVGPPARTGHVLATGGDTLGQIAVLFGGEGDAGLLNDTWTLSDATLQWQTVNQPVNPDPRTGHAMSAFPGQGYVLFGGLTRPSVGQDALVNDTWFWTFGQWTQLTTAFAAPPARFGHAMATDRIAKQIVLFGGRGATGVLGDTWLLDLNTLQSTGWQKLNPANSPLPRFGHTMTFDTQRNKIVLAGGEGAAPNQVFSDTWEWDATNRSWVRRNILPMDGRAGHVAFFDENLEQTIAFGGFAHEPDGIFAQTRGDTLAFVNAGQVDPVIGKVNGDKCAAGTDCGSGICADGVCCNSTCTGQCAACDVPGHEGTCTAPLGAPHGGRAACTGPTGECGATCNGSDMTACHLVPTGVTCGPPPGCNGGFFASNQGACDGAGACAQAVVSCAPYTCGTPPIFATTGCITKCDGDANCFSSDYRCYRPDLNRLCYLKDKITSFTVTPAVLTVGTTVTMTVQGSIPNSVYTFNFWNAARTTNGDINCFQQTKTSCTITLQAADVGLGTFRVSGGSPQVFGAIDDTRNVDIMIGAQP